MDASTGLIINSFGDVSVTIGVLVVICIGGFLWEVFSEAFKTPK